MGGLYSRVKVWGTTDTLTAADLNAEFDNVLTNFIPTMMQGYSVNVAQMQIQTSPGGLGSESLATQLSGELERLRFMIAGITGQTYWYQAPITTLNQLNTALGAGALQNKITSGLTVATTGSVQPIFLLPDGTTNKVTLKATATAFVFNVAGASYTISADVALTGLNVAVSSNNLATIADTTMSAQTWTKIAGENGTVLTMATVGTAITSLAGQYAAFKNQTSSEYFIARVSTASTLVDVRRGYFFDSTNTIVARAAVTNGDVIQLMKLTWIYATTSGGLSAVYTNPTYAGTAPSAPSIGDYWFDQVNNLWKVYNGSSFVASNSTLVGVCIQDTTKTVGARSFDFYEAFSSLNTAELVLDPNSSATVRSRYIGAQFSIYGTSLGHAEDYISWAAPGNNASGTTVTAGNFYYFYVDMRGNPIIDVTPPYDRRSDLQGFYHPNNTFRCLGYAYATGNNTFSAVETFYRGDTQQIIQNITTSANNAPVILGLQLSNWNFTVDTSGGAYTQLLPPVAAFKGKTITYMKTTTDNNLCTLQQFEPTILTTTQSSTFAQTTITCASGTGITSGLLVMGVGIPRGTTVTAFTSTTATLSQPVFITSASIAVTFGNPIGGIASNQSVTIASYGEIWQLFSTGTQWIPMVHHIPQDWTNYVIVIGASTTPPTKGPTTIDSAQYRRDGSDMLINYNYKQSSAGSAGSGTYLYPLPFGTFAANVFTTQDTGLFGKGTYLGSGLLSSAALATSYTLQAQAWNTNNFYISLDGVGTYGSSHGALGSDDAVAMSLRCPITGWVK